MTAEIIPLPKRKPRLSDGIDGLWTPADQARLEALGYRGGDVFQPHPAIWPYPEMEGLGIEFDEDRE